MSHASTTLLASTRRLVSRLQAVRAGETLAWVSTTWAKRVAVEASGSASFLGWPGLPIHTTVTTARHLAVPVSAGQAIGTAVVSAGEEHARVRLVVSHAVTGPSLGWRLTHP